MPQRTSFVDITLRRIKCSVAQKVAFADTKLAVGMAVDQGQKHQMTDKLKVIKARKLSCLFSLFFRHSDVKLEREMS